MGLKAKFYRCSGGSLASPTARFYQSGAPKNSLYRHLGSEPSGPMQRQFSEIWNAAYLTVKLLIAFGAIFLFMFAGAFDHERRDRNRALE